MAENEEVENTEDDELSASADEADLDELPSKKLSGKKLVLFVVLPLFLVIGGGGGLYFSGLLDGVLGIEKEHEEDHAQASEEEQGPGVFYDVPDMIVNLNESDRKQRFLKLSISLELDSQEDVTTLEAALPRVTDHLQTYLRELRLEDLKGSAGIYRIRQELLERVRTAIYPAKVRDVLFREILVQ